MIAEPSSIVRCGLSTILQQSRSIICEIVELSDLSTLLSGIYSYNKRVDLLIVNPSSIGYFSPSMLKDNLGNEELRVVALQSGFVEPSMLNNYDLVISTYDAIGTITEKIEQLINSDSETLKKKEELSIREREIIICVVKGMTNKQIADALCLSTHTIIAHRRNIANKLQIHSPSGLTIYAIVNKLVDLSEIKNTINQSKDEE